LASVVIILGCFDNKYAHQIQNDKIVHGPFLKFKNVVSLDFKPRKNFKFKDSKKILLKLKRNLRSQTQLLKSLESKLNKNEFKVSMDTFTQ
jgi:hypothetical protein